ncbi:MAG: Gfo/Idh/MocA family oxidoreductase [Verrucomicrobiota bacterium]
MDTAGPRPLRIGFVGAGGNTRLRHLPGFAAISGVGLTAVANRSVASSEAVAREFGIGRVESDWRAIVDAPDIDAVCIGTWPNLHAEITVAALAAGKHVLTEARMARDAAEAGAMLAASRAAPALVAQIVPAPFTLNFDAEIRRRLDAGALGELREIGVVHTHGALLDASAPITWRQRADLSGHNLMTLGIHYEALLRWLDDDAEVEAAHGFIQTPRRRDETGVLWNVDIPDEARIAARFPRSGARLSLHLSGLETGAPRNDIRLAGTAGTLRLDLAAGVLWFASTDGVERRVPVAAADDGWRVEADFVASIREGRAVTRTDFVTGIRYMRFTDAVWAALSAERTDGGSGK